MVQINTPQFMSVTVPGGPDEPTRQIDAVHSPDLGRYIAATVTVSHPFEPVTTSALARSAVRRHLAQGLREQLLAANPVLGSDDRVRTWARGEDHRGRRPAAAKVAEPDEKLLASATTVLHLERIVGGHAVKTLARCFALEHEEAVRWARKADRLAARD